MKKERIFVFKTKPTIISHAAVVGKKEGEGPMGKEFDYIFEDSKAGQDSWEQSESRIHREAVTRAIKKSGYKNEDIDMIISGDLLDQCTGTAFSIKDLGIPFTGVYGACSTMALSMLVAATMTEAKLCTNTVAATSSHFCSAEKQFRMPLEYGGQRPPTAQWTATASGAVVVSDKGKGVKITSGLIGTIQDMGITDANNMGAAMAPAACDTISKYLKGTKTKPSDYDMILTGDLGVVGTELLLELLEKQESIDISGVHNDCGLMIYDLIEQDVNSGGSGCGCSGAVVCSNILRRMEEGELKKILFIGTGALLSAVSPLQSEPVPGIAHLVCLEA